MQVVKHILDNPVWHALLSGNEALAQGTDTVKFFPEEVSPFVGLEENTDVNFSILSNLIPFNRIIIIFSLKELLVPPSWSVIQSIPGWQMIYEGDNAPAVENNNIIPLTDEHIPQMLFLTKLTNPGPFSQRTIDFGHYEGIYEEDKLVAMAGQRFHANEYAEISAVCTHPNHLGKGYARQLLLRQVHRIQSGAGIPFLHVRSENSRAISVYESLGFKKRKGVFFYVLKKR